jgi:hypothetical protein
MAYDSPKAIHFSASRDGLRLAHNHPVGLAARWAVAHKCRELVGDMSRLDFTERLDVVKAAAEFNHATTSGVIVQLELTPA